MTAYNSLDGSPSTANNWLLNKKLKQDWHFKGFVISDAGAVGGANVLHYTAKDYPEAGKKAITNGLDVIFQTAYEHHSLFIPPFLDGGIEQKRLNDAVARVLTAKFELGLFEHPYVSEQLAAQWVNNTSHKLLARKAALESIVLLKNENQVLPISKQIHSAAVIGPDAIEARLGGYSGPGNGKSNILEGIREKLGKSVSVNYAEGVGRSTQEWTVISSEFLSTETEGSKKNGLKAEYFKGLSTENHPEFVRIDPQIDFHWTLFSPDPVLAADDYSVKWTGNLLSPGDGVYKIGLDGNDGYKLYINDSLLIDNWHKQSYHTRLVDYVFEKNKQYTIRIEFYESAGNAHIRLIWTAGIKNDIEKKMTDVLTLVKNSEMAIFVAGIQEGEFQDRASLALPGYQEKLIQEIAKTGKPVVVVLVNGSAITMQNWLNKVDGVLEVWYPGEEGGHAVADVLFGDSNPAGRLPITFPLSEAQLPLVYNHKPTGRGDDYNNLSGLPLFPFGYGMSYTSFSYSSLVVDKKQGKVGETFGVHCVVSNTGKREGDEVVQLYIRDMLSSVARPVLELKGFQRVHLAAGESKIVSFLITPEMLQILNEKMEPVVEPGEFRIMIGSSSRELQLKDTLQVINK